MQPRNESNDNPNVASRTSSFIEQFISRHRSEKEAVRPS